LQVNAGNPAASDREVLRKSRNAYNQLEYLLRHGGIQDHGHEARVFTLPNGEKLTLQEFVEQMSRALLKSGVGGDWQSSGERAREIQRHKPELSALVEDAGWCLALADALDGPLPDDVKKRLRYLHESYSMEVAHDEIVKQVNGLLPSIQDERLRKELKKLANRSWERDKRAGKFKEPLATVKPDSLTAPPPPKPDSAPVAMTTHAAQPPVPDSSLKAAKDRVDTLILHGHYLEALRAVESIEDNAGADWVKDHRQRLGDRYCEERRMAAATTYAAARKTTNDSTRIPLLRQSLGALDSCLFHFPDASVSAKVRRNKEMVEKELKH
jgi:hypothetical protein